MPEQTQASPVRFIPCLAPVFMRRFQTVSKALRSVGILGCGLAALVLANLSATTLQAQESAALRGTIRNSQGKSVAGATVELRAHDPAQSQTVLTDAQGIYIFSAIHGGVYLLRATMAGYGDAQIASLFFGPRDAKTVDLTLLPVAAPEFFDEPQFKVSGVTDTTNLGGHGSDTTVRARDALAKETVALGKSPPVPATTSEAEKSLRASLEREPDSFELNHRLGKMLLESGRAGDALPYLERAQQLMPRGPENAYGAEYENSLDLLRANAFSANYAGARDGAQALLAHYDNATLHHLLGDAQEKLGDFLDAVREYQRAAELEPSEAYIFDGGAELLLHHAPEPAADVFARGNKLFPDSVRMLVGLGAALFARGSVDQAVERICEASDLHPNDPIPYVFLGKMQASQPLPSPNMIARLHRFVSLQPDDAQANYYYAAVLWKLRKGPQDTAPAAPQAAQVESLLTHAIRLDPKFAAAYLQLGILHSEQRNYTQAVADYQHAIQADASTQMQMQMQMQMEEPHYRLAQAYRQMGDVARAEAEIQIYDRIAKQSAEQAERERHEMRQFVYTLRDQSPPQSPISPTPALNPR
jgi:tetratricopeptide (TPR) repeat protein